MHCEIVNLIPSFVSFWKASKSLDGNQKAKAFKESYINQNKDFFSFYFKNGFGKKEKINYALDAYTNDPKINYVLDDRNMQIEPIVKNVIRQSKAIVKTPDIEIRIVLLVGVYGFGFWLAYYKDMPSIFVAIEQFDLEESFDIFLAHELAHIIHSSFQHKNSKFFNLMNGRINSNWKTFTLSDYLLTDGIATYLSTQICPNRKEYQYLGSLKHKKEWLNECNKRKDEIYNFCFDNLEKSDRETLTATIFMTEGTFELPRRIGYYTGYHLIKNLCTKYTIEEIMRWPIIKYKKVIREELKKYFNNG